MEEKAKMDNRSRMREIREVLFRNHITRGVTPEKLRVILEELGPTYIKLGQIMSLHSDILPKAYCDELIKLNFDVRPMPFSEVEAGRTGITFFFFFKRNLWAPHRSPRYTGQSCAPARMLSSRYSERVSMIQWRGISVFCTDWCI